MILSLKMFHEIWKSVINMIQIQKGRKSVIKLCVVGTRFRKGKYNQGLHESA